MGYYIFLGLWIGLPIVLAVLFVLLLIKKIKNNKAIKSGEASADDDKIRHTTRLFIITTVWFGIVFSCALFMLIFFIGMMATM